MRQSELTVPSFAKINWTLEVLGRRPDGYHELRTILQTVSLADTLTFTLADDGIELSCNVPGIPTDESNLVVRAALSLQEFAGVRRGVRVDLVKHIPAAAGLGGGSGNAAITLLALRHLLELEVSINDLIKIGSRLGADVPFFLLGGTGIGVGRGDEVYPLADVIAEHILLVNAGIAMPTREVYAGVPVELTKPGGEAKMPFSLEAANRSITTPAAMPLLRNDLEAVVYARHPLLGQVRDLLLEAGACGVLMSGSGATIFALFDSEVTRSVARKNCTAAGWWCAPVRAFSRNDYRLALAEIAPF